MMELNARGRRSRLPAASVLLAALALAGCSATHVGESWQCPLAQGESCASVAAADPAVPERAAGRPGAVLGEPLYRVRPGGADAEPLPAPPACGSACGPFAWLAGVLGLDGGEAAAGPDEEDWPGDRATAADGHGGPAALAEARPSVPSRGTRGAGMRPAAPFAEPDGGAAPRSLPAPDGSSSGGEPAPARPEEPGPLSAPAGPPADELREPEVIGRIWIAPFVDADGIYREGHFVRAVLAPGAWRLP